MIFFTVLISQLGFRSQCERQSGGSVRKSGPSGKPASPPNSCGAAFVWFGGPVAPASIQGFHTSLTHFSLPGFLLTGHKLSRGRGRWRSDTQEKKKKKKDQSGPDSVPDSTLNLRERRTQNPLPSWVGIGSSLSALGWWGSRRCRHHTLF